MGRTKRYQTEEERENAKKENKRRSYQKYLDVNRDKYRWSALRTYYLRKAENTTDEKQIEKCMSKVWDLTNKLTVFRHKRDNNEEVKSEKN